MPYRSTAYVLKVARLILVATGVGSLLMANYALRFISSVHASLWFVPARVLVLIILLPLLFSLLNRWWRFWACRFVGDVLELQKVVGLLKIEPFQMTDLTGSRHWKHQLIKERFDNYQFQDDLSLSGEHIVCSRKLYQDAESIAVAIVGSCCILLLANLPEAGLFVRVPLPCIAYIGIRYFLLSDPDRRLRVGCDGVGTNEWYHRWEDILDWKVHYTGSKSKRLRLHITCRSGESLLILNRFKITAVAMVHLLHVYQCRWTRGRLG